MVRNNPNSPRNYYWMYPEDRDIETYWTNSWEWFDGGNDPAYPFIDDYFNDSMVTIEIIDELVKAEKVNWSDFMDKLREAINASQTNEGFSFDNCIHEEQLIVMLRLDPWYVAKALFLLLGGSWNPDWDEEEPKDTLKSPGTNKETSTTPFAF